MKGESKTRKAALLIPRLITIITVGAIVIVSIGAGFIFNAIAAGFIKGMELFYSVNLPIIKEIEKEAEERQELKLTVGDTVKHKRMRVKGIVIDTDVTKDQEGVKTPKAKIHWLDVSKRGLKDDVFYKQDALKLISEK